MVSGWVTVVVCSNSGKVTIGNYSGVVWLNKTCACEAAIISMIAASLLFLCFFLFFPVCRVYAWDFSAKTLLGYDTNPGREANEEETFFTLYQLGGAERFVLAGKCDVQVSAYVAYQDLVEVGDNVTGGINLNVIFPFWQGKALASLFVNPEVYRDHYSREDEVNCINTGLETTFFLTPTLDLLCKGQVSYINYCNRVTPFSNRVRPGKRGHPGSPLSESMVMNSLFLETPGNRDETSALPHESAGHVPGKRFHQEKEPQNREDWFYLGELVLDKTLSESLSLRIGSSYRHVHSSIEVESHDGIGVNAGLDWLPAESWSLSLTGWWLRRVYDRAPGGGSRHDYERGGKLSLTCSLARFDVFMDCMMMCNRSPLDSEDYRRKVIQCGVIFSF
jgi:hypothetical protein